MTWGPVTKPATVPTEWVTTGDIASVVIQDDLTLEFGTTYAITQELLDLATAKVEERIRRPLRNAVWTERLPLMFEDRVDFLIGATGWVRPRAIPVQEVLSPAGTVLIDNGIEIHMVSPDVLPYPLFYRSNRDQEWWATVTYQGGYTPAMLPSELRTIILKVAIRMKQRQSPGSLLDVTVPGVNNPRNGDVSFSTGLEFGTLFDASDTRLLKRYEYRGAM